MRRPSSILILDDDKGNALLQRRQLERAGYTAVTAQTPEESFHILSKSGVDLIIVDYRLNGDVTGLGFCARLRAAGYDVPVVMVSGTVEDRHIVEALRMGVREFVEKDADFLERVPAVIGRVLERVAVESQLAGGVASARLDLRLGGVLILESDDAAARQQARHLERAGYTVTVARTPDAAIEIVQRDSVGLLILDQRLPENRTGLEIYEHLRARGYDVPAILMTAYSDMATAARALRSGIRDYIEKTGDYALELPKIVERVFDRVRLERQATDSKARLAAIVGSATDAIMTLDVDGVITLFNRAAEDVFCCPAADAVGTSVSRFLPGLFGMGAEDRPAVPETLRSEARGHRGDGTEFPVEVTVAEMRASGGRFYTVIARDITHRKEAEDALRAANENLKRANADLEQFAYISSHDLQEPLRTISVFTERLDHSLTGRLDEEGKKSIGFILSAAARMRSLITDTLRYTQLSAESPHFTATNMEELVGRVLRDCKVLIEETGAVVTREPLPTVRAQASHMEVVFRNLLTNALKYRGDTPPLVHIRAEEEGNDWVFSVQDNGIGFQPQYAQQIFGFFKRLHGREVPGTGIGLALCKRIIESHGGRIWATSQEGLGATFYFTLPAAARQGNHAKAPKK